MDSGVTHFLKWLHIVEFALVSVYDASLHLHYPIEPRRQDSQLFEGGCCSTIHKGYTRCKKQRVYL